MTQIQSELLITSNSLPASFVNEHKEIQVLLLHLAISWKETGNMLYKRHHYSQAINSYNKALELYHLEFFIGAHTLKELPIYSNLAIVYLLEKRNSDAIAAANTGLAIFDKCSIEEKPLTLQEKLIFNLIKALCAQAQDLIGSEQLKEAHSFYFQAHNMMIMHESKLGKNTLIKLQKLLEELLQGLPIVSEQGDSVEEKSVILATTNSEVLGNLGLFSGSSSEEPLILDDKNSPEVIQKIVY